MQSKSAHIPKVSVARGPRFWRERQATVQGKTSAEHKTLGSAGRLSAFPHAAPGRRALGAGAPFPPVSGGAEPPWEIRRPACELLALAPPPRRKLAASLRPARLPLSRAV